MITAWSKDGHFYCIRLNFAAKPPPRNSFTSTELALFTTIYCVANSLSCTPSDIRVILYLVSSGKKSNFRVLVLSDLSQFSPPMYHESPFLRAIIILRPGFPSSNFVSSQAFGTSFRKVLAASGNSRYPEGRSARC